jgi:hypothetical protein
MVISLRRNLLLVSLSLIAAVPAFGGSNWTQPTPEQLKMTSDPAAPDAPAVYLFREEVVDDKLHYHRLYAQIKILNDKGKEEFSDIEMPYEAGVANVRAIEGRTIHPDGTVVPFTGKPYVKELVKAGDTRIMAKVFSLPDVQVGSILEYQYELQYEDNVVDPPQWIIQQPVFVHKAHYRFVPTLFDLGEISGKDSFGKEKSATRLLYFPWLPAGDKVRENIDGSFDLAVDNVPAIPDEEYSPPLSSFSYRLIFYYASSFTGAEYWKQIGKEWSKNVDQFANPSDRIRTAVAGIVAPGDTDDQKLQKIYKAVMTLDNTRFTREHTDAENKAAGLRVKTAADIWEQKRGSDDEIARLFISMARAAGLKAYAMAVTERNRNLLNTGYLSWNQLEDEIAIVQVGGKEVYFDPGQRYCEYGKLHWMHTEVLGVRQSDAGATLATAPQQTYPDNVTTRIAELDLGSDGNLKGVVRIAMKGAEALRWRQAALRSDEQEVKRDFEGELQSRVPDGVHVAMDHFINLTNSEQQLMAIVNVNGSLGTQTGKRILLPSGFFEAREKTLFPQQKRENAVDLLYPSVVNDQVKLNLASGLMIESVPANAKIPFGQFALYQAIYKSTGATYVQARQLAVGNPIYKAEEYPQLREFFQKSGAQDQEEVILKRSAVEGGAAAAPGKSE